MSNVNIDWVPIKELKKRQEKAYEEKNCELYNEITNKLANQCHDLLKWVKTMSKQECRTCCATLRIIDKGLEEV